LQAAEPAGSTWDSVKERPDFWNGVLRAAGTEPRTATEIGGASGVRHAAIAIGVDDVQKRLVVISSESDARSAALAQADVQAATPDYSVIVARPLIVSAGQVAAAIAEATGGPRMSLSTFGNVSGLPQEEASKVFEVYLSGAMQIVDQWIRNARSVRNLSFSQAIKQLVDQFASVRFESNEEDLTIDLTGVTGRSTVSLDAQLGICGFPLYEMSDDDLDAFLDHRDLDLARDILRRCGVLQFFFPAPDQLLLGAIDRGAAITGAEHPTILAKKLGHPSGQMELVPTDTKLTELVDALRERKFLVEGDVSVELTEGGMTQRASVKFSPREGIISKVINRISVSLDLKQIIGLSIGSSSGKETARPEPPREG
jgi:hypothetical protein